MLTKETQQGKEPGDIFEPTHCERWNLSWDRGGVGREIREAVDLG